MTKLVRIENADNSNHKIRILEQLLDKDGNWVTTEKPLMTLDHPTDMASWSVWEGRRLIIEEYK
jgi:hypothetical protein